MKEILADIRRRLQAAEYKNEEHVRLSLVARLLQRLGWDIWSPREVNAEFVVVPNEDNTKVDFALFSAGVHKVYIEVKAVGRIANLEQIERQLRDYNRNNTALFCVITDGHVWRLYYSQIGGEFSEKCFKVLDLVTDNLDDIENSLTTFLSKQEILGGKAEQEANSILCLTRKQRAMADSYRHAQKQTQLPPFPNFPDALVDLVAHEGFSVTREEAASFIEKAAKKKEDEQPALPLLSRPGNVQSPLPSNQQGKMIPQFDQIVKESLSKAGSFEILKARPSGVCFFPQSWSKVIPENGIPPLDLNRRVSVFCHFDSRPEKISLIFTVAPMNDAKLRRECVKALAKAGFKLGSKAFNEEAVWSRFFSSKQRVSDPRDEYQVREAVEKLLAQAKDQFSKAEAVLRNVFQ